MVYLGVSCGHPRRRHLNHGMGCAEPDAIGDFCGCRRFEEDTKRTLELKKGEEEMSKSKKKAPPKVESVSVQLVENGYSLYANRSEGKDTQKVFMKGQEDELLDEVRKIITE